MPARKTSICLGHLINPSDNWWEPNTELPDGSYALIRSNEQYVELITDLGGSRTIWYIFTDEALIASSSQRAIIYLLKNFIPDRSAISWMLSSGTLGPGFSWDSRINMVPPNTRIILERSSWKLEIEKCENEYQLNDG